MSLISKSLRSLLFLLFLFTVATQAWAQAPAEKPVGVISLVWGAVTVKHTDADYAPARWLEPIYLGDKLKTDGPGSKLLIVFFQDNHQEVMGEDLVAEVQSDGLSKTTGTSEVRKDAARNPFGAGGVENPFVYTHRLIEDDFEGGEEPGVLEAERSTLRARVNADFPPSFKWEPAEGASYQLKIEQPTGEQVWSKTLSKNQYRLTPQEANKLLKGVNYKWSVTSGDNVVVRPYEFKLLTLPLKKWFDEQASVFTKKRSANKLERSDYTDYLLLCSQILDIDRAMEVLEKMRAMDPNNPLVFRALTRIYLLKNSPGHALAAHKKLEELGGRDPIYP